MVNMLEGRDAEGSQQAGKMSQEKPTDGQQMQSCTWGEITHVSQGPESDWLESSYADKCLEILVLREGC